MMSHREFLSRAGEWRVTKIQPESVLLHKKDLLDLVSQS